MLIVRSPFTSQKNFSLLPRVKFQNLSPVDNIACENIMSEKEEDVKFQFSEEIFL